MYVGEFALQVREHKNRTPKLYLLDAERPIAEASAQGLLVVKADDHTLQLDLDGHAAFITFLERFDDLLCWHDVETAYWTESKSGNKHVYVKLKKPLEAHARISLQMYLGSDPAREFLNTQGVLHGKSNALLLFEKTTLTQNYIYVSTVQHVFTAPKADFSEFSR